MQQLQQMNRKMNMLLEANQALDMKIYTGRHSILTLNPDVQLPELPLQDIADVIRINQKLSDPKFLDQMVSG